MTELENFMATKGHTTKQTQKNYRSQYKSIRSFLGTMGTKIGSYFKHYIFSKTKEQQIVVDSLA